MDERQCGQGRRWWANQGEPLALTGLALGAVSLGPLALLGWLSAAQIGRAAVILAWMAVSLLLLRLPILLRHEGRRVGLLLLTIAGLGGLLIGAGRPVAVEAQSGGLSFRAAPRIGQASFERILSGAGSPAAPQAAELYTIIVGYGLDPAVALAFFQHESQYCTTGRCARSDLHNWGMLRRHIRPERNAGTSDGFARYATWQDGVRDWCELMLGYINRGMDTVEKAVPVYAPQADGNTPTAYISAIRRLVTSWGGQTASSEPLLRAYTGPLDQALLAESFLAAEVEFHPTWAFHQYLLEQARQGRALGVPIEESRIISVEGKRFAVQVFALDTLYTPLSADGKATNWSDVRRLSDLLRLTPGATPTSQP